MNEFYVHNHINSATKDLVQKKPNLIAELCPVFISYYALLHLSQVPS